MIRGLTTAGIGQVDSLEQFVTLASQHGFGAVDTDGDSLRQLIDDKGQDGAVAFLEQHNVQIGSLGLSVEWRSTDEVFNNGLQQLVRDAEVAAAIGCKTICTYVLPSTDLNAAHFMALATKRLRLCAQLLNSYGIRLGLEFVGPHHLRTAWQNPFIWDQYSTLDWIDAIGEPNVGLLYDAYHWYTNESTVADIHQLQAHQIVHVHINDAPDVPVSEALDRGRLYPGEGIIDLTGFLQALKHIGYNGVVSQEILTTTAPEGTPEELIARSAQAFDKVFGAAQI